MNKYHISIRILHWLVALIIFGMLIVGFTLEDTKLYSLHKSFGVVVLALFFLRFVSRILSKAPDFPVQIKKTERVLAKVGHFSLYALMFLMPISGWLMSNFSGRPVKLFGFRLFDLVGADKELAGFANQAHEILAYLLVIIVSLHVIGFLKHLIVDKLNLLKRIL